MRGCSRNDQPDSACGTLSLFSRFGQRSLNTFQSGSELLKKSGPGRGGRNAPRRSSEQLET